MVQELFPGSELALRCPLSSAVLLQLEGQWQPLGSVTRLHWEQGRKELSGKPSCFDLLVLAGLTWFFLTQETLQSRKS